MDDSALSNAVVEAIGHTAVPRVDTAALVAIYGTTDGERIAAEVLALVQQASRMPIEWGDKTLLEGVNDIMSRFRKMHPGLSVAALREIGRCVSWGWR